LNALHAKVPSVADAEAVLFEAEVLLVSLKVVTNGSCIDDKVLCAKVLMHGQLFANFLASLACQVNDRVDHCEHVIVGL
jgi:hypothetical protein